MIWRRRLEGVVADVVPSMVMRPSPTSYSRGSSETSVVFPEPGRPDQRHALAGVDREVDVVEHPAAGPVVLVRRVPWCGPSPWSLRAFVVFVERHRDSSLSSW